MQCDSAGDTVCTYCGWVNIGGGGFASNSNGFLIWIYSAIPTYACQLTLHTSRALDRLEKHDKCSPTTIRGRLPLRLACLILLPSLRCVCGR